MTIDHTAYIFIVLLAGYSFSISFPLSRFYSSRETGYRIYFRTAFYALFVAVCGYLLHMALVATNLFNGPMPYELIGKLLNDDISIVSKHGSWQLLLITLVFGLCAGHLFRGALLKKFFLQLAIADDDFERTVVRSMRRNMPMEFTMEHGKVYIGFVRKGIDPGNDRNHIRILPLVSGYRDSENYHLVLTTHYSEVYDLFEEHYSKQEQDIADFDIVLPVDRIMSARMFNFQAYNNHFKELDS